MAKKAKYPNISANLYDGDFAVYADCIGEDVCRFKRTYTIPGRRECRVRLPAEWRLHLRGHRSLKASDYANNFG